MTLWIKNPDGNLVNVSRADSIEVWPEMAGHPGGAAVVAVHSGRSTAISTHATKADAQAAIDALLDRLDPSPAEALPADEPFIAGELVTVMAAGTYHRQTGRVCGYDAGVVEVRFSPGAPSHSFMEDDLCRAEEGGQR